MRERGRGRPLGTQADRDARRTRSGAVEERARSLTSPMLVTAAGMVSVPLEKSGEEESPAPEE